LDFKPSFTWQNNLRRKKQSTERILPATPLRYRGRGFQGNGGGGDIHEY